MYHMTFKKNLFVALVVGSALAMAADSAFAWGRHGSCGSSGGSWGGSHGSWGGGSWGSCGSSGGSWGGSHGSWGGGYAYYGGYYGGGYASNRVIYDGVVVASKPSEKVIASAPAVKTRLTIHVPAEAKVTLAGVDTKQSGDVRQFATTKLASGQTWDGYKVVAELTRDGQTLRQERTIKLVGGEAQDLSIEFDSTKLAKN
jgi:uncharacterized protein (TIGR03000 family)